VPISSVQALFHLSAYNPENLLDRKMVNVVKIGTVELAATHMLLSVDMRWIYVKIKPLSVIST
jgi:hypothetical protein